MKTIILTDFDKALISELRDCGYNTLTFTKAKGFDGFLGYHTDLFFLRINNTLFVSDAVVFNNKSISTEIIKVHSVSQGYPFEAGLNCLYINNKIFCNTKTIHPQVKKFAEQHGIQMIHTNQGYTKCSVAVVGENAAITEDVGLYKTLIENGVDILLVEKGYVQLVGYDYGFIGGASIYDSLNQTVFFFGDINAVPYSQNIYNFCEKHKTKVVCLIKDKPLTDYGSAILL